MARNCIKLEVDSASLDAAIEKADRLVQLLQEAAQIIDSLSKGRAGSDI